MNFVYHTLHVYLPLLIRSNFILVWYKDFLMGRKACQVNVCRYIGYIIFTIKTNDCMTRQTDALEEEQCFLYL